jgi:hypothetical protein
MNKSKITAYTALATIMSASVAYADLSLSGFHKGKLETGDNTSGVSNGFTTSSVYVTYGSTLDNGMGLSAGFSISATTMGFSTAIDTGMGTLGFGTVHNSAVDGMDSMPAGAKGVKSNVTLGAYSDGDTDEGNGIKYTSPSMNGWTLAYSMGETVANGDRNSSVAVKGSVAGVSLAAGAVDDNDGSDDNFYTIGYSVAGVDLGYGMYDDDAGSEATVIGLSTSMAGLSLGYTYEENDASTDTDMSRYSVGKDLGGMALTLFFTDTDDGTAADNQQWMVTYAIGF